MRKCPICGKVHDLKKDLELTRVRFIPNSDEYRAHIEAYVYCNFGDQGMSFYAELLENKEAESR